MSEIRHTNLAQFERRYAREPLVLLSLIRVVGSSYQPVGAFKWVSPDRRSVGMISGGCLEDFLIDRALGETERSSWQEEVDSLSPEDRIFGTALGCRGRLTVQFERLAPDCPRRAAYFAEQQRPKLTVPVLGGGLDVDPVVSLLGWRGWQAEVLTRTAAEQNAAAERGLPAQELSRAGLLARLDDSSPGTEPKVLVMMSHHFPTDLEVLGWLITADVRLDYLGILGSRQRIADLKGDLSARGTPLPRYLEGVLHAPLGLAGMGKGEHAVALALVAELQSLFGDMQQPRPAPEHRLPREQSPHLPQHRERRP